MKRRGPDIHRAMYIGRFAESDFAKLPFNIDRIAAQRLNVKFRRSERYHDIIVTMSMPQRRITRGHGDVPNPHELVFKFRMMPRLAFYFDGVLRRVRLRNGDDGK